MRRILIVGAGRGIGLGLARRYLTDGWTVHATARTPAAPGELGELPGDLRVHGFDVRDHPGGLVEAVGELDVLIHNAGVGRGTPRDEMMEVNAVAPIRLVQAFIDAGAFGPGGKVAIMTSQLGARRGSTESLGDYGDSKAALNDEFRRRADEWGARGLLTVVVHPGWVRTDMGGPGAPLGVDQSVDGMVALIESLRPEHHGRFWTWDGREHPW